MDFKGFFALQPHQGKEFAYENALKQAGYHQSGYLRAPVKFALFDLDNGPFGQGWSESLKGYAERGIPLFLYPHGARPMVQYDGILKVHPDVRCMFTHAAGGVEVMRAFGFPLPVEAVGWTFCKIEPFRPSNEIKSVLFGPIHPNENGWLSQVDKEINAKTFVKIHAWCQKSGARLQVRHLHAIEENGLPRLDDVIYYRGSANQATADIDMADLVIGHQTFAFLAVARGKPTLMMSEETAPHSGNTDANFTFVASWEKYKDRMMYPLDVLRCRNLDKLIDKAMSSDSEIREWRERFIGEPFNGKKFVERLEAYL